MYEFLTDSDFLKAKNENKHYYFGKVLTDVPTWDDIFLNVEKSVEENSEIKFLSNGIVTHRGDSHMEKVKKFHDKIANTFNEPYVSSHVYIAITKFFPSFGKHKDPADVFFWNIIGQTQWKIWEKDDTLYEYNLSVGDIIYVPAGTYHRVISLTPRVGISIGIDYI